MYSRILVAIDGSPGAAQALRHAVGLAKGLSASLRIIHVVDIGLMPYGPELSIDIDALLDARRAAGEKILAAARDSVQAPELEVETRLLDTATPVQHVAAAVAEAAASWPADLLVLGTHGRRGVERWLLGSVAEGAVRRSTVPVLLIPVAD
ncbi:MAG: universal stress protein [Gammaproteobacteria bacterium]|nr:universal stress protein [Gammaproteobacteria bacterium]